MLNIDKTGTIIDDTVKRAISPMIEHGPMPVVRGIIVHQTDAGTVQSTLNSYKTRKANGAHFVIDKDGTIYQTASVYRQTNHVGKLKSRCLMELRCSPAETKLNEKFDPIKENRREMKKSVPDRFPSNQDSIGIELVGRALPLDPKDSEKLTYEQVTDAQNQSLRWLVTQLQLTLGIPAIEVFRHPTVSRKNETEAGSAKW